MNRNFYDAMVDITHAIPSMGAAGIGIIVVAAIFGFVIVLFFLDKNKMIRRRQSPQIVTSRDIDDLKRSISEHHGSSNAHHQTTHGMLHRLHDSAREKGQ